MHVLEGIDADDSVEAIRPERQRIGIALDKREPWVSVASPD
jgi:hypothetical protein